MENVFKPIWVIRINLGYTERFRLLSEYVLNSRYCVCRNTGVLRWRRGFSLSLSIVSIVGEFVIAEGMRGGVYCLSLTQGKCLWTSHAQGWKGKLLRAFDFAPFFVFQKDFPVRTEGNVCITHTGRRLDVKTGAELGVQTEVIDSVSPKQIFFGAPTSEWSKIEHIFGNPSAVKSRNLKYITSYVVFNDIVIMTAEETPLHNYSQYDEVPGIEFPRYCRCFFIERSSGRILKEVEISDRKISFCEIDDADNHGAIVKYTQGRNCYLAYCAI